MLRLAQQMLHRAGLPPKQKVERKELHVLVLRTIITICTLTWSYSMLVVIDAAFPHDPGRRR